MTKKIGVKSLSILIENNLVKYLHDSVLTFISFITLYLLLFHFTSSWIYNRTVSSSIIIIYFLRFSSFSKFLNRKTRLLEIFNSNTLYGGLIAIYSFIVQKLFVRGIYLTLQKSTFSHDILSHSFSPHHRIRKDHCFFQFFSIFHLIERGILILSTYNPITHNFICLYWKL